MPAPALWFDPDPTAWSRLHASYSRAVEALGVASLPAHDAWYREELPAAIRRRAPRHLTLAELTRVVTWKMARGEWRARNLALVRQNADDAVERITSEALAFAPHPTKPIATVATLAGVGPATASAVLAAAEPATYPFLDELVAAQVPTLGSVRWTLGFYARYAEALRERAAALGSDWTPVHVERALWTEAILAKG